MRFNKLKVTSPYGEVEFEFWSSDLLAYFFSTSPIPEEDLPTSENEASSGEAIVVIISPPSFSYFSRFQHCAYHIFIIFR